MGKGGRLGDGLMVEPERIDMQPYGLLDQGLRLLDRISAGDAARQVGDVGTITPVVGFLDHRRVFHAGPHSVREQRLSWKSLLRPGGALLCSPERQPRVRDRSISKF